MLGRVTHIFKATAARGGVGRFAQGPSRVIPSLSNASQIPAIARAFHASSAARQDSKPAKKPEDQKPLYDESKQSDSWQYDPKNDPMLKLKPEELEAIKKDINSGARNAVNIGYGVLGFGALIAVGILGLDMLFRPFRLIRRVFRPI